MLGMMKDKKMITLNKDSLEPVMHRLLYSRFFQYTHLMKLEVNPFRCTSVNIFKFKVLRGRNGKNSSLDLAEN